MKKYVLAVLVCLASSACGDLAIPSAPSPIATSAGPVLVRDVPTSPCPENPFCGQPDPNPNPCPTNPTECGQPPQPVPPSPEFPCQLVACMVEGAQIN